MWLRIGDVPAFFPVGRWLAGREAMDPMMDEDERAEEEELLRLKSELRSLLRSRRPAVERRLRPAVSRGGGRRARPTTSHNTRRSVDALRMSVTQLQPMLAHAEKRGSAQGLRQQLNEAEAALLEAEAGGHQHEHGGLAVAMSRVRAVKDELLRPPKAPSLPDGSHAMSPQKQLLLRKLR